MLICMEISTRTSREEPSQKVLRGAQAGRVGRSPAGRVGRSPAGRAARSPARNSCEELKREELRRAQAGRVARSQADGVGGRLRPRQPGFFDCLASRGFGTQTHTCARKHAHTCTPVQAHGRARRWRWRRNRIWQVRCPSSRPNSPGQTRRARRWRWRRSAPEAVLTRGHVF